MSAWVELYRIVEQDDCTVELALLGNGYGQGKWRNEKEAKEVVRNSSKRLTVPGVYLYKISSKATRQTVQIKIHAEAPHGFVSSSTIRSRRDKRRA